MSFGFQQIVGNRAGGIPGTFFTPSSEYLS